MKFRSIKITTMFLLTFALVSCAGYSPQIGTSVTLCCPGNYAEYVTYSLETKDMPLFLEGYMVAEFDDAMREKGLIKANRSSDLEIILSYKHISLDAEQQNINPFIRAEDIKVELRYLAVIEISMFDRSTSMQVWGGEISRFHSVRPGEYMHEDSARPSFQEAFATVLENYPG